MGIVEGIEDRKVHLWKIIDGLEFWVVPNQGGVSTSIHHHYRGYVYGYSIVFLDRTAGVWGEVVDLISVVKLARKGAVTRVNRFLEGYRSGRLGANEYVRCKWKKEPFPYQSSN